MKWEEVRRIYPDQFVLVEILNSHIENKTEIIDDVAVVRSITDPKEATYELIHSKGDTLVYHTSHDRIEVSIRTGVGFRGVI